MRCYMSSLAYHVRVRRLTFRTYTHMTHMHVRAHDSRNPVQLHVCMSDILFPNMLAAATYRGRDWR